MRCDWLLAYQSQCGVILYNSVNTPLHHHPPSAPEKSLDDLDFPSSNINPFLVFEYKTLPKGNERHLNQLANFGKGRGVGVMFPFFCLLSNAC